MIENGYRPWGLLSWMLEGRIQKENWSILGCLSSEDRCLATTKVFCKSDITKPLSLYFFEIIDEPSEYTNKSDEKRGRNRKELEKLSNSTVYITTHNLLESSGNIVEGVEQFIKKSGNKVILDISSFPKRFFFPILRLLLENKTLSDIIVTYTVPDKYHEGELAKDPDDFQQLPLFMSVEYPEPVTELAIVGVGFLPFGLPDLLKDAYSSVKVNLFFPFPPGPPNYQRTWEFVRKIEHAQPPKEPREQIFRINAIDASDSFDHILSLTSNGEKKVIFAPYGPKPISLAMCIYATKTSSPVYYTQPRSYHPEYCTGIKYINGLEQTYAYCIRLNNIDFYNFGR